MQNTTSYKELHENFMYNHKGSTIWECLLLVLPCPILIYFISCIMISSYIPRLSLSAFLLEFLALIVPIILSFTIFSDFNHLLCYVTVTIFIYSICQRIRRANKKHIQIIFGMIVPSQKRPYITYFRSVCSILTALCILAVDFPVFPRRFAKTESYGFGIMDTGVGFYIISNALVAKQDLREHFVKSIKTTLPILGLGIMRCLSLKSLDYQEHVSEYGVYWNFFFTLSVVKLSGPIVLSYFPRSAGIVAVILAVLHQAALSSGLEAWVVGDTPRAGILSANREGLVSLPGYASLYFAGVSIGRILSKNNNIDLQADGLRALKLFVVSGVFYLITLLLHPHLNVSRRLINLTYITWLIGFSLLVLGVCLLMEVFVRVVYFTEGHANDGNIVPILTDAVNYNALFFFIIANLFTGFVNLTIKTLYTTKLMSILILIMYMLFICYVVSFMYRYRIRIKL